ncbi:MAG: exodeoxyribonuclease VII small subunit [Pseudomonadota bacterium]
MAAAKHADIKQMSYETALQELEQIVARLERGDVDLEESIEIFERGAALRNHCNDRLGKAEARVEKLTLDAAGQPSGTEPLQDY